MGQLQYGYVISGRREGAVLGRGFAKTPQFRAHALEHLAWYLSFCSSCHLTEDTPLRKTALDTPTFGCAHAYLAENPP